MIDKVIQHAKNNQDKYLSKLFEELKISSISTLPAHKQDCLQATQWLKKFMKQIGLEHVQLVKTGVNPIVYADWLHAKDRPTVLIYGHYDVQPIKPLEEWKSPPFEPKIRGDYLYARGVADNKAQHIIFLSAVAAYLKTLKKLPLNVKFAIEGMEEMTSMGFEKALQENTKLFSHDASIIADTEMFNKKTPAITYGLRGIITTEVVINGPKQDLHSGTFGGAVENPANVLTKLLASLQDKHGKITIPGFYDDVANIDDQEKAMLKKSSRSDEQILKDASVKKLIYEKDIPQYLQRKLRPSLSINGMCSGFYKGVKTIIPTTALAKLTIRLVPNQNPDKIYQAFKQYILNNLPPTVRAKVKTDGNEHPVTVDYKSKAVTLAKQALEKVFNHKTVFKRVGFSVPAAGYIHQIYQKPMIMTGFILPDSKVHSPNENFYLPNFAKGIEASIRILENLSRLQ